jgi:hypothetical protein
LLGGLGRLRALIAEGDGTLQLSERGDGCPGGA